MARCRRPPRRRRRPATHRCAAPPRRASARTGVEPMFTSATPGSSPPTAATPTIAQSWARRLNFSNAQPGAVGLGHPDLGDHLVGCERGLEEALEEVVGGDHALTATGPRTTMRAARGRAPPRAGRRRGRRARASRRACRGDGPADRRPRPRPRAAAGTCSREQRRSCSTSWWRVSPPIAIVVAGVVHVGEVAEPTDVDEHRRGRQPQLHERQQRVTAGEELGVVAVLGEQRDRFVDGVGAGVVERGRDHRRRRHLRRAREHRLDDVVVAGAAAEVALEALAHLGLGERRRPPRASDTAAITMPGVQ